MPKKEPEHPIQVAARRSGLSQDVIRAWERRYHAVTPRRSGTNRRLYSDEDVERLFLLAQVTRAGRRIGDVARLSLKELSAMVGSDRQATARVGEASGSRSAPAKKHLAAALDAVERLDGAGLEAVLADARVDLPKLALVEKLLGPLLAEIGERWRNGSLRVAHEHMASALVRSFLGTLTNGYGLPAAAPEVIVAAPAGQRHEFGGLMAAVTAASDGWRVTYLGVDLPADEIAAAFRQRDARALALSITYPADDPGLVTELKALRSRIGAETPLLIGGAASGAYESVLNEIGARVLPDLHSLGTELAGLRRLPA